MMSMYLLAADNSSSWRFAYVALFFFAALILPFVVGKLLANWLRMKDYGWKIGLILCFTVIACWILGNTWDPKKRQFVIPQGVDLKGGVILIYEVDNSVKIVDETDQSKKQRVAPDNTDEVQFSMPALIEALSRRINPSGTKEIVVRPYGKGQVEIIIPEVDQQAVEQIKKVISTAGVLQFRIVANSRDHQDIIEQARDMALDSVKKHSRIVYDDSGEPLGLWARVAREAVARRGVYPFKVDVSDYTIRNATTGDLIIPPPEISQNPADRDDDSRRMRLAEWVGEQGIKDLDVLMAINDDLNVNGSHLGSVMKSKDEFMNPDILFNLKGEGINLFASLTETYKPDGNFHRQLGIVLDNELLSAPNIQEQIRQHGRITGRFTDEEVQFLVNILEAGSLPVVLNKNPISESTISPLLGRETIEQGKTAIAFGTGLVFVFMLVYYRFSGFLACLALALNILFTIAIMVLIKAPLTLPGLAGLVLSVGMSVDANVLVFERMREEVARGTALRMTIRNGFARATATIIDTNLTTVLTAVILYAIGTDQLRGFSVTLILGILTSMFTAIFCTRVAFDIVERHRILSTLKMFQFIGETNLDFIGKRHLAIGFSVIIIAVGLVGAVVRGEDLFDIDFTGGSSVHVTLEKPADSEDVRAVLDKKFGELKVPYTLTGMSVTAGQSQSRIFKVDAKLKEVKNLEDILKETFKESTGAIQLAKYSLDFGELKPVAISTPATTPKVDSGSKSKEPAKSESKSPAEAEAPEAAKQPAEEKKSTAAEKVDEKKSEPTTNAPAADTKTEPNQPATPENPPATSEPKTDSPKSSQGAARQSPSMLLAYATELQEPAKEEPAKDDPAKDDPAKDDPAKKAEATPAEPAQPAASPAAAESKPAEANASAPNAAAQPSQPPVVASSSQVEVQLKFHHPISEPTLRDAIDAAAKDVNVPLSYFDLLHPDWQRGSSNPFNEWTLRISATPEDTRKILEYLQKRFADTPVWSSSNKIGPQVAGRMQRTAIVALIASWLGIVIYVWIRFQNLVYGVAAVIALIHDVLVTVAAIAVSKWLAGAMGFLLVEDFKISLTVVAALLTIIGYSINDTIVIFDRLREVKGKSAEVTVEMLNMTLNQTLSRTLLTAFLVFLTVIVLYGFGGQGIHGFAFAMLIGVISGTYSTVYIATPFVLWLAGKSAVSRSKSAAA